MMDQLTEGQKTLLDVLDIKGCDDGHLIDLAAAILESEMEYNVDESVYALSHALSKPNGIKIMRLEMSSFWTLHEEQRDAEDAYDEKLAAIHEIKAT